MSQVGGIWELEEGHHVFFKFASTFLL